LVDLDRLERNVKRMAGRAHRAGLKLRPHIKTHKSLSIARMQLEAGAVGVTVAKLGEAEAMAAGGVRDILVAYPIVGEAKLERLERLVQEVDVIVSLDSVGVGEGISAVGQRLGKTVPVYVEVDSGLGRLGKKPGEESVRLIASLLDLPGVEVRGLMTHGGYAWTANSLEERLDAAKREAAALVETKQLAGEKLGFEIPEISPGSTPTAHHVEEVPGITEIRPGTYVFYDATSLKAGLVNEEEVALTIRTTVVATPSSDRAVIDAGSKTLTTDMGAVAWGHGLIKGAPGYRVNRLSEEHGMIITPPGAKIGAGDLFRIGQTLDLIPNHVCPTVNLADELVGVRDGRVEEVILVEGRGKNR
jgi:D-serine deaminase-like pyridoxal phosphate-dependent protein